MTANRMRATRTPLLVHLPGGSSACGSRGYGLTGSRDRQAVEVPASCRLSSVGWEYEGGAHPVARSAGVRHDRTWLGDRQRYAQPRGSTPQRRQECPLPARPKHGEGVPHAIPQLYGVSFTPAATSTQGQLTGSHGGHGSRTALLGGVGWPLSASRRGCGPILPRGAGEDGWTEEPRHGRKVRSRPAVVLVLVRWRDPGRSRRTSARRRCALVTPHR